MAPRVTKTRRVQAAVAVEAGATSKEAAACYSAEAAVTVEAIKQEMQSESNGKGSRKRRAAPVDAGTSEASAPKKGKKRAAAAADRSAPESPKGEENGEGKARLAKKGKKRATATIVADPPTDLTLARAKVIREVLARCYPNPPCPLDYQDDFTLLCAVMLSAQTTDGKVNQVTPELFRLAPNPARMAAMEHADVLSIIRTVGLAPTKAKNLIATAGHLVERFGGRVPRTYEELESLPGVGHKTASVVMCEAFGEAAFPVDTHIHRLALRWALSKAEKDVARVEADLKAVFPQECWNTLHLQMIYFGREHCQAKNHSPSACPVCAWVSRGQPPASVEDIPQLKNASPKKASKTIILYSERRDEKLLASPGGAGASSSVTTVAAVVTETPSKASVGARHSRRG